LRRRSRARSALVTIKAVALSVSRQQSSRWSGLQIQREAITSATVTRSLRNAFGFWEACLLWATRTWATCSDVVPYSYMWRMKVGAKFWPALRMPNGTWARSRPRTGWAARAPVPPMRKSE
jgi:hypothetical protein